MTNKTQPSQHKMYAIDLIQFVAEINGNVIPSKIYTKLGKVMGLSRERIRQYGLYVNFPKPNAPKMFTCYYCGKTKERRTRVQKYCSQDCRRMYFFYKYWKIMTCPVCKMGKLVLKSNPPRFCSEACRSKNSGIHKSDRHSYYYPYIGRFEEMLPKEFTIKEFQKAFNYTPYGSSGWVALNTFVSQGYAIKTDNRGVYKLR